MDFSKTIRNIARDDSRRFAKGTYCKIVHEKEARKVMYKHKIVPEGLNLSFPVGKEHSYFDIMRGQFFVIPASSHGLYLKEIEFYKEYADKINSKSVEDRTGDEIENIRQKETVFADFLRQNLVLITVPALRVIDRVAPDPTLYDVIIETTDINQTMDCIFVKGGGKFRNEEAKLSD